MTHRIFALLAPGAIAAAWLAGTSAAAQTAPDKTVCMGVTPATKPAGPEMVIAIDAARQQSLAARGFVVRPCGEGRNFAASIRARACPLAAQASPARKEGFLRRWHLTLSELCEFTTEAAGSRAGM